MPLYTAAKTKLYEFLRLRGCNSDEVAAFFDHEDQTDVASMGFGSDGFEKSVRNTIRTFCPQPRVRTDDVNRVVRSIHELIVRGRTPVASHANQILADLRDHYRFVLLTKGDQAIQK